MEIKRDFKTFISLCLTFLKIGAVTFGGGYVMLAIIRDEFVEKKNWVSDDELLKVYAIAESTPGPVAINAATYIGNKAFGLLGAIAATFFEVLPAFVISVVIALYLNTLMEYKVVQNAFMGIKAGVAVLILFAGINTLKKMKKTPYNLATFFASLTAMCLIDFFSSNFSSIYIIVFFGVLSLFLFAIKNRNNKAENESSEEEK